MGAVGGMLGLSGGAGGTGFSTMNGASQGSMNTAYNNTQAALTQQQNLVGALAAQNGLGNQSQVYNQLQGVANGTGPNPAQAQLAQSTGANVANQAALMAGQRGASSNVGLMARQNAQQGANLQQQAAGQGASMQAQQSLNALSAAGQLANTQAANQIGQTNAALTGQQNEQNTLEGANSANNANQASLAGNTMGMMGSLLSGAASGAGAGLAMAAAHGGMIQNFDQGGVAQSAFSGPQSMFAQALQSQPDSINASAPMPSMAQTNSGIQQGAQAIGKSLFSRDPNSMASQNAALQGQANSVLGSSPQMINDPTLNASRGGDVGDRLKGGGHVPGEASIKGDSLKNDTVKAMLSPGEVVIPRSVMNSKDPIRGAAEFVRDVMSKKGRSA